MTFLVNLFNRQGTRFLNDDFRNPKLLSSGPSRIFNQPFVIHGLNSLEFNLHKWIIDGAGKILVVLDQTDNSILSPDDTVKNRFAVSTNDEVKEIISLFNRCSH